MKSQFLKPKHYLRNWVRKTYSLVNYFIVTPCKNYITNFYQYNFDVGSYYKNLNESLIEKVRNVRIDEASALIDRGADLCYINGNNKTVLHCLAEELRILCTENTDTNRIISFIKKIVSDNINIKDGDGKTPLHLLVSNIRFTLRGTVILEAIQIFVKNNLDVNAIDKDGNTALHTLILQIKCNDPSSSNRSIITLVNDLIEKGADINIKNNEGNTVFDLAVSSKVTDDNLVVSLIKSGADTESEKYKTYYNSKSLFVKETLDNAKEQYEKDQSKKVHSAVGVMLQGMNQQGSQMSNFPLDVVKKITSYMAPNLSDDSVKRVIDKATNARSSVMEARK